MSGEELTRFPIQPQDRHQTAKSSDDIEARPEDQRPGRQEERPQDKPVTPPRRHHADEDQPDEEK